MSDELILKVTPAEFQAIMIALSKFPFDQVAAIIQNLQQQASNQGDK